MELWIDLRDFAGTKSEIPSDYFQIAERVFGEDTLVEDGKILAEDGSLVGGFAVIDSPDGQAAARNLIGSVDWLLVECGEWTMIPLENLIAEADDTPTKIAVKLDDVSQVNGAAFALEIGVDALLLSPDASLWEAGMIAKSIRSELEDSIEETESISAISESEMKLVAVEVKSVESGSVGERVCIDFIGLLEPGEGLLVGSSSKLLVLVHAETVESGYVPPRPFRVNAGPVHSYTLKADGKTCYLSEIGAGEELLVVSSDGSCRPMVVGRVKIESRPLILFTLQDENAHTGHLFLQQAETVRLVGENEVLRPATELVEGEKVRARVESHGRHIGLTMKAKVEEK